MTRKPRSTLATSLAACAFALAIATPSHADEPAALSPPTSAAKPAPATPPATKPATDAPLGRPAEPTAAGTTGLVVKPGVEVIAEYQLRVTRTAAGSEWFHTFELPRAHGSITGEYGPARARIVLEAVRSASEGALLGVAGDSLVFRVREASAGFRHGGWLAIDAGVVPTLTVPELDGTFAMRALAASPAERAGLYAPADLGATARALFPDGYGFVAIAATNGEGYTGPERNRGKNLEVAVEVHPLAAFETARPIGLFASYVAGSSGVEKARADRVTGALVWQGTRLRGAVAITHAWGVGADGDRRSLLVDAFLRAEPVDRLIFGVRGFSWLRDLATSSDRVTELTGAAGYRIADPLEAFLAVARTFPEAVAKDALPGLDRWTLRAIARACF